MRVQELRRTWTLTKSEVASGHLRALGLTAFPGRVQFTPPPHSLDHALEEGKVESFYSPFLKLTLCCLEQPSPLVCLCSPRAPSSFPTFVGGTVWGAWLEADPALLRPCTLKESSDERWKPGGREKGHSWCYKLSRKIPWNQGPWDPNHFNFSLCPFYLSTLSLNVKWSQSRKTRRKKEKQRVCMIIYPVGKQFWEGCLRGWHSILLSLACWFPTLFHVSKTFDTLLLNVNAAGVLR